jgi:AraC-like DNA-binding protein
MHVQEFPEINIVINGCGKHYIEDNCLNVSTGDIFFIPPNVRHGYIGNEGFDVFHVLIHQRFIDKNSADFHTLESFFDLFRAEPIMRTKSKKPLYLHLCGEKFSKIRSVLAQMEEYPDTLLPSDCIARSGLTMVLIPMLCKAYSESEHNNSQNHELKHADECFMKAISKIHECYKEKLTVEQLAKIANLSRSAFIRRFTEICKLPPSEYIIRRRLESAEYMLRNTSLSIGEIAFENGFYDASHLNKAFISHKGLSPNAFRRLNSGDSDKIR